MGGLLHLVQWGRTWVGCGPAQSVLYRSGWKGFLWPISASCDLDLHSWPQNLSFHATAPQTTCSVCIKLGSFTSVCGNRHTDRLIAEYYPSGHCSTDHLFSMHQTRFIHKCGNRHTDRLIAQYYPSGQSRHKILKMYIWLYFCKFYIFCIYSSTSATDPRISLSVI